MRRFLRPLWMAVAVVFLVEAWLWRWLGRVVHRCVELVALPALKARLKAAVTRWPAAVALLVFGVPVLLLVPVKLLGLWLLGRGAWLEAVGLLALAKATSVGLTAFLLDVTRPRLRQIGWFCRLESHVLAALGWARRQVEPARSSVRAWWRTTAAPVALWLCQRTGDPLRARWVRRIVRLRQLTRRREGYSSSSTFQ